MQHASQASLCVQIYIYTCDFVFIFNFLWLYLSHVSHKIARYIYEIATSLSSLKSPDTKRYVYEVATQSMWQLHIHSTWTHYVDFWRPYFWGMNEAISYMHSGYFIYIAPHASKMRAPRNSAPCVKHAVTRVFVNTQACIHACEACVYICVTCIHICMYICIYVYVLHIHIY